MSPKQDAARNAISNAISKAIAPDQMDGIDAIEVLEEIRADIDGMIDALRDENADD